MFTLAMGLFSRTPKPNPKLAVDGIELEFHRDQECWSFTYRGTEFCSFEPALTLPARTELDGLLATLESLQPEIRSRLGKGLCVGGDAKLPDGESCSVNLQDFATDKSFIVSWSDGKSWGDLVADFTTKEHRHPLPPLAKKHDRVECDPKREWKRNPKSDQKP